MSATPAPIAIGESRLYPALSVGYLFDSNAFVTPDEEVETNAVVVAPRVDWVADRRLLTLVGSYAGEYAAYDEDVLDYADHTLSLSADAELGARRRTGGSITYLRGHETLGLDLTRGIATEVDELVTFDLVNAEGRFRYGASDARVNVEGGARLATRRYASLEELTDGGDYASVGPYALVSFRVSGDTRALVESRFTVYDFENDRRDRNDLELLTGLEFAATGALSGAARIGARVTSYDDDERADEEDGTGLILEADVIYRPSDFIRLSLTGEREIDNTETGAGDEAPIRTLLRLGYRHEWSSRFFSNLFVSQRLIDRSCSDDTDAGTDTIVGSVGAELGLRVRRWLEFGVDVSTQQRSAENDCARETVDEESFDYTRTLAGVYVRATL